MNLTSISKNTIENCKVYSDERTIGLKPAHPLTPFNRFKRKIFHPLLGQTCKAYMFKKCSRFGKLLLNNFKQWKLQSSFLFLFLSFIYDHGCFLNGLSVFNNLSFIQNACFGGDVYKLHHDPKIICLPVGFLSS